MTKLLELVRSSARSAVGLVMVVASILRLVGVGSGVELLVVATEMKYPAAGTLEGALTLMVMLALAPLLR